ncbi:hypothetical protein [Streptomyces sp. NPDC002676]
MTGRHFDLVIVNPPYVPALGRSPVPGPRPAPGTGTDGRLLIDRICAAAPVVLRPGRLLMVRSYLSGVEKTLAGLRAAGLRTEVVDRARSPAPGSASDGRRPGRRVREVLHLLRPTQSCPPS